MRSPHVRLRTLGAGPWGPPAVACVGFGIAHWPRHLPVGSSLLLRLLRTGFWLPLWLSFLLATPCGPAAAQLPEAVEGRLLDHESSRPIANATVALQATDGAASPFGGPAAPTEAAVLTDASGRFRIPGVPAGRYRIQVRHLAYGVHRESVSIEGRGLATIEVRLTPTFIQLSTVVAEGEREREMSGRDSPASGNVVARDEIDRASLAGENLGDLLALRVVGIQIRRDNAVGGRTCVEFRTAVGGDRLCRHPLVYIDGAVVPVPLDLFESFTVSDLEWVQVIPPSQAGSRYGPGSVWGVILLETRSGGARRPPPALAMNRAAAPGFD